jgi:hypothetical protein
MFLAIAFALFILPSPKGSSRKEPTPMSLKSPEKYPPHLRQDLEPCDPKTDRVIIRTLLDASPVPTNGEHRRIRANGQQQNYEVLSIYHRSMRDKRIPLESIYQHHLCGQHSQLPFPMADTLATDPNFYDKLFCHTCGQHFPTEQFSWSSTGQKIPQKS